MFNIRLFFSILFIIVLIQPSYSQYCKLSHRADTVYLTPLVKSKSFKKSIAAPVVLTLIGLYSTTDNDLLNKFDIHAERNESAPQFHHKADNYLQYVPILAVYGLNLIGIKGEHDFRNRTALLHKTELLVGALTWALKNGSEIPRPDTQQQNSFPSGHTAQAFAVATFMHKEYGKKSIWYSIGAYSVATTVGAMRIMNNRHWVSDVLVGAGIGILSTNLVYITHAHRISRKQKEKKILIVPTLGSSAGIYFRYKL